ncbi:626_t:CDS:2 [Ambispora gerdemannii]|uniref:626_t:CDS:1 n=1 Tax=Ambispora gerdemannii TaxID=144530 RepID=A0A9N8Z2J7_9GLOM|nr:626_t:CDS:2 [Ambispora gerdemannii]
MPNMTYAERIAKKRRKVNALNNNTTDELAQYLSGAILSMDVDPLDWWKLNSSRFPYMSQWPKTISRFRLFRYLLSKYFQKQLEPQLGSAYMTLFLNGSAHKWLALVRRSHEPS